MLSIEEIRALAIEPEAAKEAHAQAEKRLADLLETKKSFEQRATSLLTAFSTLALAIVGAGGAFYTSAPLAGHSLKWLPVAFFAASIPMLIAMWCMICVLKPAPYGALGSLPKEWLIRGLVDAPTSYVPKMNAYLAHGMQARIEASQSSNDRRANLIAEGSWWAFGSPIVLTLGSALAWAVAI